MPRLRGRTLAALVSASLLASVAATTVVPAVALGAGCSVTIGAKHFSSLTLALKGAAKGATLTVKGTCSGNFVVTRPVTIKGGRGATLKGANGRVVTVKAGPTWIGRVTITGGSGASACPQVDKTKRCGGGVFIAPRATVVMDRVSVIKNHLDARGWAGAGIANYGRLTLTRSLVAQNTFDGAGEGGGISNAGTLSIVASTIRDNAVTSISDARGGGLANQAGRVTISRSLISGNQVSGDASSFGGGIFNVDGKLTIDDSTLSGNSALSTFGQGVGGAIGEQLSAGNEDKILLHLWGSTVTDNHAVTGVGGIRIIMAIDIRSSIIAGNDAPYARDCYTEYVTGEVNHTLIGTTHYCDGVFPNGTDGIISGTDATPVDAKLGPLAANGGSTRTHALLDGSPALNAAGGSPCATKKDQRGKARPLGSACDMGAFERA